MAKREKARLMERLTRPAATLVWALAAMHYRTGAGGTTYAGMMSMLGTMTPSTARRIVGDARRGGALIVKVKKRGRGHHPLMFLTKSALRELEGSWLGHS